MAKSEVTFYDWFHQIEAYGLKSERFYDSLDAFTDKRALAISMVEWLKSAYYAGKAEGIKLLTISNEEKDMSDITMCKDTRCPQNERCYRYVALPNYRWQSYFLSSPKKMDSSGRSEGCPEYWTIEEEHETGSRYRNIAGSQDDSRSSN